MTKVLTYSFTNYCNFQQTFDGDESVVASYNYKIQYEL